MRVQIDKSLKRHRRRPSAAWLTSVGLLYALGAFVIRVNLPMMKTRLQISFAVAAILLVEAVHFFRKPFDPVSFLVKLGAVTFGMILAKIVLEGADVVWSGMVREAGQMLDALGV